MDVGTVGGIALGLILILGPILTSGYLTAFIDIPSVLVTIGGTFAAILITYPLPKVKILVNVAKKVLNAGSLELAPWYQVIIDLAAVARRDGILALEDKLEGVDDDFLKKGLQMLVDGNPADIVSTILEMEIENMQSRHEDGHFMWKSMGSYAPAFGMIGTLIGLVLMLQDLSDPSKIGVGMAVALLTTLYGAFVANLFCIPIQGKLEQRTKEEVHLKHMLLAGILSIQAGDSPRVVGDKLLVYLSPADRAAVTESGDGE
jgi:chemotaxis protein MotA